MPLQALKASPTLPTHASDSVEVGGPISDTATLAGGVSPTGNISFAAFGPDDSGVHGAPGLHVERHG